MRATFKVHKVRAAGAVELVTLHPIDQHEIDDDSQASEWAYPSRSGDGKIQIKITEPGSLGEFREGGLVEVMLLPHAKA